MTCPHLCDRRAPSSGRVPSGRPPFLGAFFLRTSRVSHLLCPSPQIVGQAFLPAAAFQAALSGDEPVRARGKRRLKAGGSQDWQPHNPEPA